MYIFVIIINKCVLSHWAITYLLFQTTFHGSWHKFSDHILKTGLLRDNGFNTSLDKSRIIGPNTINRLQDRISFHRLYHARVNDQAETNII